MIKLPIRQTNGRLTSWWINLCSEDIGGRYSDMVKGLHESAGGYYKLSDDPALIAARRDAYLEFEDDAKASWFLLRWS